MHPHYVFGYWRRQHNKPLDLSTTLLTYCYIGETYRAVGERISEHLKDIEFKRYGKSEVAYHFNQPGCTDINNIKVYILEFVYEHPESKELDPKTSNDYSSRNEHNGKSLWLNHWEDPRELVLIKPKASSFFPPH